MFVFFFIIGVSVEAPGGGVPAFGCIPICLRISSSDGMPGVGVTPGFIGFFISTSLGIPGVGAVRAPEATQPDAEARAARVRGTLAALSRDGMPVRLLPGIAELAVLAGNLFALVVSPRDRLVGTVGRLREPWAFFRTRASTPPRNDTRHPPVPHGAGAPDTPPA